MKVLPDPKPHFRLHVDPNIYESVGPKCWKAYEERGKNETEDVPYVKESEAVEQIAKAYEAAAGTLAANAVKRTQMIQQLQEQANKIRRDGKVPRPEPLQHTISFDGLVGLMKKGHGHILCGDERKNEPSVELVLDTRYDKYPHDMDEALRRVEETWETA